MKITYDEKKREATLKDRGLDFADAPLVFAGETFEFEDTRKDYGERRILCYGTLGELKLLVGYVQRGDTRHIFTMRRCHEEEWKKNWV